MFLRAPILEEHTHAHGISDELANISWWSSIKPGTIKLLLHNSSCTDKSNICESATKFEIQFSQTIVHVFSQFLPAHYYSKITIPSIISLLTILKPELHYFRNNYKIFLPKCKSLLFCSLTILKNDSISNGRKLVILFSYDYRIIQKVY